MPQKLIFKESEKRALVKMKKAFYVIHASQMSRRTT